MNTLYRDLGIFLCATLLLLFNYPLLSISDADIQYWGIPMLYLYILIVWIMAIIALYRISRHLFTDENPNE